MIRKVSQEAILGSGRIMKDVIVNQTNDRNMISCTYLGGFFDEGTNVEIRSNGKRYSGKVVRIQGNLAVLRIHEHYIKGAK